MKVHNPSTIAAPLGAYSNGIATPAGGQWLHIAGQVGVLPDGSLAEGFEAQADAAWRNLLAVLEDAGMGVEHLVKVQHFLLDPADLKAYGSVRARHLGQARPASTLLFVAGLAHPGWKVEIDAVAWKM